MRPILATAGLAALALGLAPLAAEQQPRPIEQQIGAGGRPVGASWSRSPVHAPHGMAATAHPLATQIS